MRRLALAAVALAAGVALAQERAIAPGELKSGSAFYAPASAPGQYGQFIYLRNNTAFQFDVPIPAGAFRRQTK